MVETVELTSLDSIDNFIHHNKFSFCIFQGQIVEYAMQSCLNSENYWINFHILN